MRRTPKVPVSRALTDTRRYRRAMDINQDTFWARFGTTQSGGSRYEAEGRIPGPLSILLVLYENGRITDDDLAFAKTVIDATHQSHSGRIP